MNKEIKMINNYNNNSSDKLPEGAEVCCHCNKAQIVPITSQENYITLKSYYHYGSDKDGLVETYDVCISCFNNFIKQNPKKVEEF